MVSRSDCEAASARRTVDDDERAGGGSAAFVSLECLRSSFFFSVLNITVKRSVVATVDKQTCCEYRVESDSIV